MKMVHVTIQTADLEKSRQFYEEVVGLKIIGDLRPNGAPIIFMADGEDTTAVELIQNPEQAFNGSGISIGFHTEDVEAKRAQLEAAGFKPTPMISPMPQVQFFFVEDPNGVIIQFI